jgi:uncharacterized protein (TIRG00374 family)
MKTYTAQKLGAKPFGPSPDEVKNGNEKKIRSLRRKWPLLLLVSLCLSLMVPFLLGGVSQFKLLKDLPWWAAVAFVLMICFSWVANANRLRLITGAMGKHLGMREGALMTAAAEFAGVATPGSLGMAGTYTYLFKGQGVTLGSAIGMLAVVVVTDLLFFGTMMPSAAIVLLLSGAYLSNATELVGVALGVAAGGALLLYVLFRNYRRIYQFLSRRLTHVSWAYKRRYRLARATVEFLEAFRLIARMSWGQRLGLYLSSVGYWLPRYGILLVLMAILTKGLSFAYLFLMQGVLNLGGQIFVLPGGGGGVEAGFVAFLSPYLDRQTLAFTLLVWRTFTFYWYLVVGGIIFMIKTGKAARNLLSKSD